MLNEKVIRRAFAQGVSDHKSGTFVSTIVLTLSFYTCLSFQKSTVHSVFLATIQESNHFFTPIFSPVHFFLQKSQTVLQLLLKQLFLVCTART